MMWAIFCSLAFCAFQIVFADKLEESILESRAQSDRKLTEVDNKPYKYVNDVAYSVQKKKLRSDQIVNKCTILNEKRPANSYIEKREQCSQCYREVKNTKDLKTAENCCKKQIDALEKEANSQLAIAKKCIADITKKCNKSATDCRKVAKEIDDALKVLDEANSKNPENSESD